jgi:predicted ATPase/class 3 adenylate cyclase
VSTLLDPDSHVAARSLALVDPRGTLTLVSQPPSGSVTFLFTDIEGSTKLARELGDGWPDVLARHQRLLRGIWQAHAGREISTEGDSFVVVFQDPAAAVAAAGDAQRVLAMEAWPANHDVRVRMGIHSGLAVAVGDDFVGIEVHRAARIAAAGHGGQTLVSDATRDAVATALPDGLRLRDLGRHRLKDIGVERLWQLDVPTLRDRFPVLRTLEAHPTNLPSETSSLVDRETESDALRALVRERSLVTVTGPGGIGKSRLAVAVARDLVPSFPDGVFFLDVALLDSADAVAEELAGLLELRTSAERPAADAVAEHLRDRDLLVVLDTVDRVTGLPALAARLIRECRSVRVFATGRTPLHLAVEHVFPLGPLALPDGGAILEDVRASPSVRLFVQRSQAVRPEFALTSANAATVAAICSRLDGLPLAIELAAARLRVLPLDALLARLARRLPLLTGGPRDAPDRQRTLRDTIAWSVDLLDAPERAVLVRLAAFAGEFDLAAAEAVASGDGADVLGALDALVDQSLVVSLPGPAGRFRLLATIREFVLELLDESDEREPVRERHARWFADLAEARVPMLQGGGDLAVAHQMDMDMEESRAALAWALKSDAGTSPRLAIGLRLAASLGRFWWLRGRLAEGVEWLELALDRVPLGAPAARATALLWSGVCHDALGEFEVARDRLEASLAIARQIGDRRLEAHALNSLGVAIRSLGDLDRARDLVAASLELKRALGDERGVAVALTNLGTFAIDVERFEDARRLLTEALALDRAAGSEVGAAYSQMSLGAALIGLGELDAGETTVSASLRTFAELDDEEAVADGLSWLGRVWVERGDDERGARLYLSAMAMRARAGLPERPSGNLMTLVEAAIGRLDPDLVSRLRLEARTVDVAAARRLAFDEARTGATPARPITAASDPG